jgi:pyruvate dehydrogenase E2 component (dihydrolipoamide acetyltransferase)
MATEVTMPKLGLTMTEGTLTNWLVDDGSEVKKGQAIFEIETEKVTTEAEAPADGTLRITVQAGTTVPVMGVVGYVLAPGETDIATGPAAPAGEAVPAGPEPASREVSAAPAAPAEVAAPAGPTLATPAAKRRARELKLDINQIPGTGRDGAVTLDDVEQFASAAAQPSPAREVRASPLAKQMAKDLGVDLTQVKGSGEGGRIMKEDVERAAEAAQPAQAMPPAPAGPAEGKMIPITGVRKVIADRLLASAQSTAPVTLMTEVDATELVNMRNQLNGSLSEKLGFRISYNAILVKITASALREFPYMNARQEGDYIHLLPEVNIGLATDTERGLLVPVIRDTDQLTIIEIERELSEKIERARAGQSLPDELSGGTFTITNLGSFGVDGFTPVINPPEIGILAVGRIEEKPAAVQGKVELRQRMTLSLKFDHRLVDGAPAARFLQRIRDLIEKPYLMMIGDL